MYTTSPWPVPPTSNTTTESQSTSSWAAKLATLSPSSTTCKRAARPVAAASNKAFFETGSPKISEGAARTQHNTSFASAPRKSAIRHRSSPRILETTSAPDNDAVTRSPLPLHPKRSWRAAAWRHLFRLSRRRASSSGPSARLRRHLNGADNSKRARHGRKGGSWPPATGRRLQPHTRPCLPMLRRRACCARRTPTRPSDGWPTAFVVASASYDYSSCFAVTDGDAADVLEGRAHVFAFIAFAHTAALMLSTGGLIAASTSSSERAGCCSVADVYQRSQ